MSARRSRHVALAVAGLIAGLPVAAVLQWTRPIPDIVWLAIQSPAPDERDRTAVGAFAIRPEGPRLTVLSMANLVPEKHRIFPKLRLHPATLDSVAFRTGCIGRACPTLFLPEVMTSADPVPSSVVGRWRRGSFGSIVIRGPLPPVTSGGPQ